MNSLSKLKCDLEIVELKEEKLFTINNKNEKITLYNKEMLEKIIDKNFNKKYRELLYLIMSITEDDESTESDAELALLKIEDLKKYLINHYSNHISRNLLNKYLKMLMLLEQKLNVPRKRRGR